LRLSTGTRIHALSIHADYRCEHSGACCTSGWPIPVERETHERLKDAIASARFDLPGTSARTAPFVRVAYAPADTPVVTATDRDGACAFYDTERRRCAIHRQLGPAMLPVACQQFPRVSLLDGRGLFVSLSHYCPAAAGQLFRQDVALRIVEAPAAFPPDFPYDPLDARSILPPLLKPGVLLDLETYARWEQTAVDLLGREGSRPERAVADIAAFTEALRAWTPGERELARHFDDALEEVRRRPGTGDSSFDAKRAVSHYTLVLDSIPADVRPSVPLEGVEAAYRQWVDGARGAYAAPICRYLATKVFGTWLAYEGRGLRTIVHSLDVALSVLEANAALACHTAAAPLDPARLLGAVRRTDEMFVHLASREELERRLGAVEKALP
jgi:Fe-S-cluster containining protein